LVAIRVGDWKAHFMEQRSKGLAVWREPFSVMRIPKLFNLRTDPFEVGDESLLYDRWFADRAFLLVPAQRIVGQWLESFKEFPIRQKPGSFSVEDVMESLFPKAA
jgi:arylsulfatase